MPNKLSELIKEQGKELYEREKEIMCRVHGFKEKNCECCRNTIKALLLCDNLKSSNRAIVEKVIEILKEKRKVFDGRSGYSIKYIEGHNEALFDLKQTLSDGLK